MGNTRIEYSDYWTEPPERVILELESSGPGKYEWKKYYNESDSAVWREGSIDETALQAIKEHGFRG